MQAFVGLLDSMDLNRMDDTGMYVWAVLLLVIGLVFSYGIAVWWQRRKEAQKRAAADAPDDDSA